MGKIKIACETYTWQMPGETYQGKLDHIMGIVSAAGFTGIEPETSFFGDLTDPIKMKDMLAKHNLELSVSRADFDVFVAVDRQVLGGALANLLGNAFKFTRPASVVSLSVRATALRVCIDVEDHCGGLPEGKAADLFRPFEQRGSDRSGLGLGLMIARRAVEANGGELRVLDLPHVGCRFTIDLPRFYPAAGAHR